MRLPHKLVFGLASLVAWNLPPQDSPPLAEILRASRYQQRVLLLTAPSAQDADFQRQTALLVAGQAALKARDVRVVSAPFDQLSAADQRLLTLELRLGASAFCVLLLGKDGGEKLRRVRPVTVAELTVLIDQMPMRRQEMRRTAP